MYGYPPPWYPVPPPTNFTQLPPGYIDTRSQDPIKLAKRWEKFCKREELNKKKDEVLKPKFRVFTFIEVFMLCTIFSIPVGMVISLAAVSALTAWIGAMSKALNLK